jgi:hypothetical protein
MATLADERLKQLLYMDPTGEIHSDERHMSERIKGIRGSVVALLDNANDTSNFFFQALSDILKSDYGVSKVILESKFTSTKPAGKDLISQMSESADFMVSGVCL